jgi:uncharacterized protein
MSGFFGTPLLGSPQPGPAATTGGGLEHLDVKAASTVTDQGRFSAIAAAWSVDRAGDQIRRGAFAGTIKRWQQSGKRLPVHWNHETGAESIIGAVDAGSLREAEEGLYVKGQLDLEESEVARSAWRSMKNNAVSLSFGFMTVKSRERGDGVTELLELDLFEVSVVPHPANADTRFLDLKSATGGAETDDDLDSLDLDQLRARSEAAIADIDLKRHRPIQVASFPC